MNTFNQNINNAISSYLQENGFAATENPLYFYKYLQAGVLTFVIEKTEDKNAEDEHQKLDACIGISSFALDMIKKNNYEPFMDGHVPESRVWISQLKNFNGMALETKSNTVWDRFAVRFIENIGYALKEIGDINTEDEILEFMLLKDSHMVNMYEYDNAPIEYNFGMRLYQYIRMNKKQGLIDKYIRNCNVVKQGITDNKIDETGIKNIIAKASRTTQQIQQDNFTPLQLPESFKKVCDWIDDNNYYKTISGLLEMNDNGKCTMSHWINDEKIANRFGVFGALPSGDMVSTWLQDDGQIPIIIIGEGSRTDVIAKDMDDFIALLAIGYYEFWSADITLDPIWDSDEQKHQFSNPEFQTFYKNTFAKEVLANGNSIAQAAKTCDNLREWLLKNYEPWKEM